LEPGETHQPLSDLPGLAEEPTSFKSISDDNADTNGNVAEFFAKYIPFFKTKADVDDP